MSIQPPLICSHINENSLQPVCTLAARWQRVAPGRSSASFFCNLHRQATDTPIVRGTDVQLVTVTCSVRFVGGSQDEQVARAEAEARLTLACLGVGGVVEIEGITSTTGRCGAPPPARMRRADED